MLIWVNGPFGGGKTQVAHELLRRLPGSVVCDPELVGFGLQRMTPPALREDFQNYPSWRTGVLEVLQRALTGHPGDVIVPMTLVEPRHFGQLIARLRGEGHQVTHVALLADRDVVLRRLRERVVGRQLARLAHPNWMPPSESWAVANLDRCLEGLQIPLFATQLRTDQLSVPEVAEQIAELAGRQLTPRAGPVQQRLQQTWTSVRHLRLG